MAGDLNVTTFYPGDPEYLAIIEGVYNQTPAYQPDIIFRPKNTDEVKKSIKYAKDNDIENVSILGGGHDPKGLGLSGKIVIDMRQLDTIDIDATNKTAWVGSGVTIGLLDKATLKHDLVFPGGSCEDVGVVGYVLGGGFGWLTRTKGLGVDQCIAFEVVLSDGKIVMASREENKDLFWALCGAGAVGFAAVTKVQLHLHPLQKSYVGGRIWYLDLKPTAMKAILESIATFINNVENEINFCFFILSKINGVAIDYFYDGNPEEAEVKLLPFLRSFVSKYGQPAEGSNDVTKPYSEQETSHIEFQTRFSNPKMQHRKHWKSGFVKIISPDLIGSIIENIYSAPKSKEALCIGIEMVGGISNGLADDTCAYVHRDAQFIVSIQPIWHPTEDDTCFIEWVEVTSAAIEPYTCGSYQNYSSGGGSSWHPEKYFGSNFHSIKEIASKYDSSGLFRKKHFL